MKDNTVIRTTKTIYPQIYAYITPNYEPNEGWVKLDIPIKDVDERIRQQTHIVNMAFKKLWSGLPSMKTKMNGFLISNSMRI